MLSGLQIFVIDYLLKNHLGIRRGDRRAVMRSGRLVYQHKRQILRIVGGKKAHKGGYVFSHGNMAVFVFLRSACFASNLEALYVSLLSASVCHDVFQQPCQLAADLFANCPLSYGRIKFLYQLAFLSSDFLYKIRLHQKTAVYSR